MATSSARDALNKEIDSECPICQCPMVMPTAIPACGHKFCFICLKGVNIANLGGCPICRGPIDASIFKKPSTKNLDIKMDAPLSPVLNTSATSVKTEDVKPVLNDDGSIDTAKMYWLYEGRHSGWWRFDPRIEKDIEEAYVNQMPLIEVTICGSPYVIDYVEMKQYPKNQKDVAREIKRVNTTEFDSLNVKGLSGVLAK